MTEKVTEMVLKVDLRCPCCYKKIKKILCKFPEIRDQVYDDKHNEVKITVVCCSPEKFRDKLCCKGGKVIKSIEIVKPPPPPPPPKKPKKSKEQKEPKKEDQPKSTGKPKAESPPPRCCRQCCAGGPCCRQCCEGGPCCKQCCEGGPCCKQCCEGVPCCKQCCGGPFGGRCCKQCCEGGRCCKQCCKGSFGDPCYLGYGRPIPAPPTCYDGYGYNYEWGCYVRRCDYFQ